MFDFVRFAQDHNIPFLSGSGHSHAHQGWWQTHCPQCGDHWYRLGFSMRGYAVNCWVCGPIKISVAVQGILKCPITEAYEVLRRYSDEQTGKVPTPRRKRTLETPPGLAPLLPRHVRYLESRGLVHIPQIIDLWGLMGTGYFSGKWAWRVVAPIHNVKGEIVAYVGRTIGEGVNPRYRVTDTDKCLENPSTFVYGIHKAQGDTIIIVEGPGDVWNMGIGSVATLGIDWHPPQIEKLRRYKHRVIMFDPEVNAQRKARKLAEALSIFPGETEIIDGLPSDPGSLPQPTVEHIRKEIGL